MKKKFQFFVVTLLIIFAACTSVFAAPKKSVTIQTIKNNTKMYVQHKSLNMKVKVNTKSKITYQSNNKKILKVNKNGVVTAMAPGKAYITVTATPYSKTFKTTKKKIAIYVMPWKPSISARFFSDKRTLQVKGNSKKGAYNYQYQVATDPSFHNIVAKKTGKGLKDVRFRLDPKIQYYARVRASANKVASPWSTVIVPRPFLLEGGNFQYNIYLVGTPTNQICQSCSYPFYIETNNTGATSTFFDVVVTDLNHQQIPVAVNAGYKYDDVPSTPVDYDGNPVADNFLAPLYKVAGGYLESFEIPEKTPAGTYYLEIREYDKNQPYYLRRYEVAKRVKINVLDIQLSIKQWARSIIDQHSTPDLPPMERLWQICEYLTDVEASGFRYDANMNRRLVALAGEPSGPSHITKRWDSYMSPMYVARIAQEMGGFDSIHPMYYDYAPGSDEWKIYHHLVKCTIGSETDYFTACPLSATGAINSIHMLDLSSHEKCYKFD